ncbi:MAG: hypothetical protein JWM43_2919 [Acidobacteriaceae bacterium]|nr:hypothetical protein [Acidobacteriaceae bacterium]
MGWVEELQQHKAERPTGGSRAEQVEGKERTVQAESLRMLELEIENMRLTQLVGELLLKNQRLRDCN